MLMDTVPSGETRLSHSLSYIYIYIYIYISVISYIDSTILNTSNITIQYNNTIKQNHTH